MDRRNIIMKTYNEKYFKEKAASALRESRYIDFKSRFDIASKEHWCELIKDIVAIANTGGGIILIGVEDDGRPSKEPLTEIFNLDPADITNKISPYLGIQFDGFSVQKIKKGKRKVALLIINSASLPMIFTKPGTYPDPKDPKKQKTAFAKGAVYFRHGAKSEPGMPEDMQRFFEKKIKEERKELNKNLRKVFAAPIGTPIQVLPAEAYLTVNHRAPQFRVTTDKKAPALRLESQDNYYPHRQKEVIQKINKSLYGERKVNQRDILSVRRVYKIDESRPEFCFKPQFGTYQYSEEFINWMLESYKKDKGFFTQAREKYKK